MEKQQQSWAVVGGGMMGMTIARRLSQRGQRVTLFESAREFGGLTSAMSLGDVVWDRFYHVTLLSDSRLRSMLRELGLECDMKWTETKTGFYSGGQLYSMSNTWEFLRFPPLSLIEKLRLGATIFYASRINDWHRMEKIPVEDWLRACSGGSTFEKIWLPLLRAKLGEAYKKTSAAFIGSYIARMYQARRSGLKKELFGYVPGGYARILERFARELHKSGVSLLADHRLETIERAAPGSGVSLHFNDQREYEFDNVVLTIPAPIVSKVCPGLTEDEHTKYQGIEYLGVICSSMLLKKPLTGYYVTNITDSWVPLTGIIEMSAVVDREYFDGNSLVYLPKYALSDDPEFEISDGDYQQRCIETLERMYPRFDRRDVVALRTARAKYVMALPTIEYSKNVPPMKTSIPGVYVVNSAHILKGNLNVNDTMHVAEDAVLRVLLDDSLLPVHQPAAHVTVDH